MFNNERLLDVLTRYQMYVEGIKAYQHKQFDATLRQLDETLIDLFKTIRVKRLDELSRAALLRLGAELRRSQFLIYSQYATKVIDDLKAFMALDLLVSKVLFATLQSPEGYDETPISEADAIGALYEAYETKRSSNALYPFIFLTGSAEGNDKFWSKITNTPIPANGINLIPFINGFTTSASNSIVNIVNKGYANSATPDEVLDEIRGTETNNFRDGQLTRIYSQAGALGATAIQFVSAVTQGAVASAYFPRYVWASVIDGRTTPICRSRNGNIYEYGKGPLPPAHINCRSKAVPLNEDEGNASVDVTYQEWFNRQPAAFKEDWLQFAMLKDSKEFSGAKPLSFAEFLKRRKLMLIR